MPQEGLLLQMDGSYHKWNGKDEWCLIAAIDDATSDIPHAEFFKGETTINCMKVLNAIIKKKGLPKAIYTDKAGWAGGGKRTEFSQFKNACEKLGIQVLFADSPEAKGRIEREFRTFQDRLIPELRKMNISKMNQANNYLQKVFLKNTWEKKYTVLPLDPISAYSTLDPYVDINRCLCIEERRKVGSDHVVNWQGNRYKIDCGRYNFSGFEAVFRTDLSGKLKVFIMEQEVKLIPISEAIKNTAETIGSNKNSIYDPKLNIYMANTIIKLRNRVVRHLVTGKPLNLKKLNDEVA